MLIRRIARPLLSAVFIGQGVETLRNPKVTAGAAEPTMAALRTLPDPVSSKVPTEPETAARINAAVQVGGGLLLATGKLPRVASAALAFTVIPGSLGAHLFWNETDPERKAQKRREFLGDLSLLGGLIIASADTAGKPSLGWRSRRAAGRVSEAVSAALPTGGSNGTVLDSEFGEKIGDLGEKIGHGLLVGAERGRELASAAGERSAPLVAAARRRGGELAEAARERGPELAEIARDRGAELAEIARERGGDLAEIARERGPELAEIARERGAELAEIGRERGSHLADRARARGGDFAGTARKRVRNRRRH
jgi:uncharacterized membrane protein YphA (DoxX/SURF4 family)